MDEQNIMIDQDSSEEDTSEDTSEEQLLKYYEQNREKLQKLATELEDLAHIAKDIIPDLNNFKSKYIVAERLDITTRFYDSVLRYRSEISKQLREEILLKNKNNNEDDALTWINKKQVNVQ